MIPFKRHKHSAGTEWRDMTCRYDLSLCAECLKEIKPGTKMCWNVNTKQPLHYKCHGLRIERGFGTW